MPHRRSLATALLLAATCGPPGSHGYVNYDLPPDTHLAMLRKMTSNIHNAPVGSLTEQSLQTMPDLISAWSQASSGGPFHQRPRRTKRKRKGALENIKEAEGLLRRMIDERHAGNQSAELTTGAYNAIIEGWSNAAADTDAETAKAAAARAEEILVEMQRLSMMAESVRVGERSSIEPNTETFRLVLVAWGNAARSCKKPADKIFASHRAWDTLAWMVRRYKSNEQRAYAHAKPDAHCFELVMTTWAQNGHVEAANRVEELLFILDRLYQAELLKKSDHDDDYVVLNGSVLRPTTRCFDQVLSALAQRSEGNPEAAQRAENILDHMETLADQGVEDAGPSLATYCAASGAWAKVGGLEGAHKADGILRRIEQRLLRGEDSFQPDCLAYNIVTDSFVKARSKESYKLARKVLDRQMEMYSKHNVDRCKPDVFSFSLVLNGCASTYGSQKERLKVFGVARSTFQDMLSLGVQPNQITLGIMLKCANKLLQPGSEKRESFVRDIFKRSRRDGLVDSAVINSLRLAASDELFGELVGGNDRSSKIPPEWSYNVAKKKPRRAEV